MMGALSLILVGAAATLSLVVSLFFLRFWVRTRDVFFLLFALAFAIDGVSRIIVGAITIPNESEPYSSLPRLVTFGLIIAAVLLKNRRKG
jgi:uncharacterized membrane protein HdeD (DUF308 family)